MFSDIKAGDEVVVLLSGYTSSRYVLRTVDRTTKTQVVVGNTKFHKSNGKEVTSNEWDWDEIHHPTGELMKRVEDYQLQLRKRHLIVNLGNTDWDEFTLDQLIAINEFIGEVISESIVKSLEEIK